MWASSVFAPCLLRASRPDLASFTCCRRDDWAFPTAPIAIRIRFSFPATLSPWEDADDLEAMRCSRRTPCLACTRISFCKLDRCLETLRFIAATSEKKKYVTFFCSNKTETRYTLRNLEFADALAGGTDEGVAEALRKARLTRSAFEPTVRQGKT